MNRECKCGYCYEGKKNKYPNPPPIRPTYKINRHSDLPSIPLLSVGIFIFVFFVFTLVSSLSG